MIFIRSSGAVAVFATEPAHAPAIICRTICLYAETSAFGAEIAAGAGVAAVDGEDDDALIALGEEDGRRNLRARRRRAREKRTDVARRPRSAPVELQVELEEFPQVGGELLGPARDHGLKRLLAARACGVTVTPARADMHAIRDWPSLLRGSSGVHVRLESSIRTSVPCLSTHTACQIELS